MSGCGCGCACKTNAAADESKKVLEVLVNSSTPCGSKDIADATGLDKKVISSQIAALKKQGLVDSPVRCKYGITAEGRASLVPYS